MTEFSAARTLINFLADSSNSLSKEVIEAVRYSAVYLLESIKDSKEKVSSPSVSVSSLENDGCCSSEYLANITYFESVTFDYANFAEILRMGFGTYGLKKYSDAVTILVERHIDDTCLLQKLIISCDIAFRNLRDREDASCLEGIFNACLECGDSNVAGLIIASAVRFTFGGFSDIKRKIFSKYNFTNKDIRKFSRSLDCGEVIG